MESEKNTPDKCQTEVDDGDNVFLDNRYLSHTEGVPSSKHQVPPTYTQFLFDPRDIRFHSTGSGSHRRTPSYDSRESTKSVSECSYVSGSPCESPRFHEMSLSSFSVASSAPTAPPDENPFHSEKDFVNYLLTLPPATAKPELASLDSQLSACTKGQVHQGSPPQIGLNHLENLCKLMEQLGELREHNSKLQQRVQYLEEMRNLNEIRQNLKEVLEEAIATSPRVIGNEQRDAFAFPSAKSQGGSNEAKRSASSAVKMRPSSSKRRVKQKKGRSQSMGDDDLAFGKRAMPAAFQKAKVSKWTKVMEALKWERVQAEPNDNQTMVSKATLTLKPISAPAQKDVAAEEIGRPKSNQPVKYLQKTDTMREIIVSSNPTTVTQEAYEPKPTTPKHFGLDSESSADEDELIDLTDPSNKRRSLGSNVVFDDRNPTEIAKSSTTKPKLVKESAVTDDDQVKLRKGRSLERSAARTSQMEKENKKLSKGAWGKVKTILQTRKDSLRRKQRKSACLDTNNEAGLSEGNPNEADEVWIEGACADDRVAGSEVESYRSKSKHSSSSSNYGLDEPSSERVPSRSGTVKKVPPQLVIDIQPENECNLKAGSDKAESSPTFQQTASCRGKKKLGGREDERLSGCQSVPASPSNITSFRYDDLDFLEEYFRENKDGNAEGEVRVRDRLSLAERESHHHHPVLFNLETMRNLEVMQRNVTEDFTKKMQDWERLKSSYNAQKQQGTAPGANPPQSSPHFDRKASSSFSGHRFRKTSKDKPALDREQLKEEKHREKELQWLEKQLQKIEREKQRLAKERQKYLERESQLEKMRETMLVKPGNKNKKEVLVKTSAGEFRFEGISKTFTRKLHEWETMKGIGPEVSTLTLLGGQKPKAAASNRAPSRPGDVTAAKKGDNDSLAPPANGSRLTERNRSHSESSLANMANVQTSTTSLVTRPPAADDDYNNDSELYVDTDSSSVNALSCSRVNSEPEIAFGAEVNGDEVPCAIEVEQMHIEESLPCLEIHSYHVEKPVYSYAPVEVTQLIDSSSGSDAEKEVQIIEARNKDEISKHLTNESFKFNESRVTQIKGPKTSIKNQDVSGSTVPEEVPENKSAGKERWKKKEGVNKVKEISAELMHQAKTLEQTLMDKNVTIRQLQWELLQREMSSKRFQSQLEQGLLSELASPTSKAKSSHQRSWSAAETLGTKREIENQSALNVLKKSDVASVTPIGLAQKVDELKSELNNLWSSQESTTNSICSEIGTEKVQWNKNQFKSNEKAGFNHPQSQQFNGTKNVSESESRDESFDQKTEPALKSVIIRRVSDTNVPQHPVSRISKLPMSPQMTRSNSLSQSVTPTSVRKMVQAVSPFPAPETASPKMLPKNTGTGSPYNLQRQSRVPEATSGRNGVKLNRQKRLDSNKDACHLVLRRQNAEDFQSSSDSDSESSNGVTFTINLNKSRRAKSTSSKDSPSLIKASFSPKLRAPGSPNVSSSCAAWRKNSKDEEMVSQTESDERVSAPSTPIVRSRSTRKLKPPSVNKPATGENPAVISDSPLNNRRFACKDNTAPNVRLMIEKFNKKVNEVQTYTSSSPNMSRNRATGCETASSPGVKKSTSFTDSATNFENDCSKFGYSSAQNPLDPHKQVVKSASAGIIDGAAYRNLVSKPPLSPEVARKKPSGSNLQPVGIASRIPRCLTAISEQDNPAPQSPPLAHKVSAALSDVTHSPTFGIRALEIKRAKENFLSKNPPAHPSGWRSLYQRAEPASSSSATEAEPTVKPKSILKHSCHPCETVETTSYEPASDTSEEAHVRRGSMSELTEIDERFGNQITKSASAGAVDFGASFGKSRIPSQTSTDSADKQQKSTCGLFNFKFRRHKHKKAEEALPAVKALCRQSLLVDIDTDVPLGSVLPNASNSCPSSPQIKSRQNIAKDSSDLAQYKLKSIFKSK